VISLASDQVAALVGQVRQPGCLAHPAMPARRSPGRHICGLVN